MGSKFELDHILQLAVPSLANHNVQAKRKDVDALKSKTLFALVVSHSILILLQFATGSPSHWPRMRNGCKETSRMVTMLVSIAVKCFLPWWSARSLLLYAGEQGHPSCKRY
jgi:hypothetical protein